MIVSTCRKWYYPSILIGLSTLLCVNFCVKGQTVKSDVSGILEKRITIRFTQTRVAKVLNAIAIKGNFYFSYGGNLLPKDSLVAVTADNQPVSSVLKQLFQDRFEFEEQNNYLIITAALPRLSMINTDITHDNNSYSVSGIVIDERTGERLMNASVYDKQSLAATLSDVHGYFKLKLRAKSPEALKITASKILYKDVSINFLRPVAISNRAKNRQYSEAGSNAVEKDLFGRMFISAKQRIQSMNIPDFLARRPFQVSVAPGLSTQGLFSSQVVNEVSLNLGGGYTAGVNGFELGGLFNINKGDAKYLQMAGVFNLVGGKFTGFQFAGVNNRALDTVRGMQLAGFINKAEAQLSGLQLAALNNETRKLKGVQIGLINVADTSSGISIGLINIIRNGFYKVSLSANQLMNTNAAFSTGTHDFYTTILLGTNLSATNQMRAFGIGVGHDFMLSNKVYLAANASLMLPYAGVSVDDRWRQVKLLMNVQLTRHLSLMGGPTYNNYTTATQAKPGYRSDIKARFAGWEAGFAYNSVFKPALKEQDPSRSWYIGAAGYAGVGWDWPDGAVYGGELFTQRDLNGRMSATFAIGYMFNEVERVELVNPGYITGTTLHRFTNSFKAVPLKAGMRSYASKRLFFAGELGAVIGLNNPYTEITVFPDRSTVFYGYGNKESLIYAVSTGYSFDSGLEAGLKFEDYNQVRFKQFLFRLGYRFKIKSYRDKSKG